jgi:hypothetical protein
LIHNSNHNSIQNYKQEAKSFKINENKDKFKYENNINNNKYDEKLSIQINGAKYIDDEDYDIECSNETIINDKNIIKTINTSNNLKANLTTLENQTNYVLNKELESSLNKTPKLNRRVIFADEL